MYYPSGNYEAFACPEKPANVEHKAAYQIGGGLASLSEACFLVRDAQMPGGHVHILLKGSVCGGEHDLRALLDAVAALRYGRSITGMELGVVDRAALMDMLGKVADTEIESLLKARADI